MKSGQVTKTLNENGALTLKVEDRIDTLNAPNVEEQIDKILEAEKPEKLIIDFSDLNYISSAGIRVLFKLIRSNDLSIINTSNTVYEILTTTGIDTLIPVETKLP